MALHTFCGIIQIKNVEAPFIQILKSFRDFLTIPSYWPANDFNKIPENQVKNLTLVLVMGDAYSALAPQPD